MKKIFFSLAILSLLIVSCGSPTPQQSVDDKPVANDDSASTDRNTSVNISVVTNDNFGGNGPNTGTIAIPSDISNNGGSLTVNDEGTPNNPSDDTIDYTPDTDFDGTDSFYYSISDSDGDSSVATVTVVVIPPTGPVAGTKFDDGILKYTITDATTQEVSVEKNPGDGPFGVLDIPETIEHEGFTYTVTSIADDGFAYSYDITSVNIPNSITNIGNLAFYNAYSITSILSQILLLLLVTMLLVFALV